MSPQEEQAEVVRWAALREAMPKPVFSSTAVAKRAWPPVEPIDDPQHHCAKCSDRGVIVVPDGGAGTATECECRSKRYDKPEEVPASELEGRGVPDDISSVVKSDWKATYESWNPKFDAWPFRMDDGHGKIPKFILLSGPVGCGKSVVAAWIMRRFIVGRQSARWIGIRSTIDAILNGMHDGSRPPTAAWLRRDLKVLDDVGSQDSTRYQDGFVFGAVNACYESNGFAVITTNLSPAKLMERDCRMASRALSGLVIEMKGPDARRRRWKIVK